MTACQTDSLRPRRSDTIWFLLPAIWWILLQSGLMYLTRGSDESVSADR